VNARGIMLVAAATAALACAGSAQAGAGVGSEIRYVCARAESFSVERTGTTAVVRFPGRTYYLGANRSRLGQRFSSRDATLIFDGPLVAFAADDRWDIRGCRAAAG
jgi:hypothetical protein